MPREYRRRSIAAASRREYHCKWARIRRNELGPAAGLVDNHKLCLADAEAALASKPAACEICTKVTPKLCYDHDHATGLFRGWLCYRCNNGLHMLDDPELLQAAHAYLDAHHAAV